jgi:ATP phosphoribosyltransferase
MFRIALPNKGRLADDVRVLLSDAGLEPRSSAARSLTATLGGEYSAIFVRAQDIPEFVADGAADAGITGWDLVHECGRPLDSRLDLGLGGCRLVVAVPEESGVTRVEELEAGTRVATSFPRLSGGFFAERGLDVRIVPVSGAAEVAPHLGIADAVVDLTSTGSTLRVHNLVEIETVIASSARLVSAPGLSGGGAARLDELVDALASVLRARERRYLMANVPRSVLPRIREVIPGMGGPTVVDIMNGGEKVAVHAVIEADSVFRTVADLKALGGEGILVTRIERLIP